MKMNPEWGPIRRCAELVVLVFCRATFFLAAVIVVLTVAFVLYYYRR